MLRKHEDLGSNSSTHVKKKIKNEWSSVCLEAQGWEGSGETRGSLVPRASEEILIKTIRQRAGHQLASA